MFACMPLSDEQAKAVQELAKTGAGAVKAAQDFAQTLFGGMAGEAGGVLADWAKYFRFKNGLVILDKVRAIRERRKLEGKPTPIPPKYGLPMIERACLEDDESLQDMWAGLIANASDPNKRLNLKRVFSDVLGSLEPLDVRILKHLNAQGWNMYRNVPGGGVGVPALTGATGASEKEVQLSLQNLHRLGLLVDEFPGRDDSGPFYQPHAEFATTSFGKLVTNPRTSFRPSPLGFDLLTACAS